MTDQSLAEALASYVKPLHDLLGDETWEWFANLPAWDFLDGADQQQIEDCMAGYYYVLGAADALDMTVTELLDAEGIAEILNPPKKRRRKQ